jgi:hypothetical protein
MATIALLSISCSSSKNSKGGGWYKNRNVNQLDLKEQESIVYQLEEEIYEVQNSLE